MEGIKFCVYASESLPPTLNAVQAVLANAGKVPDGAQEIRGYDFDEGNSLDGIMGAMLTSGIQATALGRAIKEVNRMVGNFPPVASALAQSLA